MWRYFPLDTESTWCLKELALIWESKAPIIPVYYYVKPHEVRFQHSKDGIYAHALRELEKKRTYNSTMRDDTGSIKSWRNALSYVANISGFELEAYNGDEGVLLDRLVECVLNKVKQPKIVEEPKLHPYQLGLDEKLKQFELLLHQEQSTKPEILGIVGLGGIGKTTLAKEFFKRNRSDYHRSCFLSDVRDYAAKGSLISLQRKLIKNLTGLDKPVNSIEEGKEMLIKPLKSFNVLVILDDVDAVNQVDALLPVRTHDLRTGSLILITTKDIDYFHIMSGFESSFIYEQPGLSEEHSLELFCSYAFGRANPIPEFKSLVSNFLKACNGLPLYLKVFGALLNGAELYSWEKSLQTLISTEQKILPTEIQKRLMMSLYNALNENEKQIFLDIACFFVGENMDMAIRIWDGSGWQGRRGFQNLQNKCLVEVDSWDVIHMHDLLRDLGREVATASSRRRLWHWTENVSDNLVQQSSVITVRGISTVEYNDDDVFSAIGRMRLQLPDSENSHLHRISRRVKFLHLIWLSWRECPYTSLPSWIPMKDLRVLQVSGSTLEALWQDGSEAPLLLEELWANGCPQLQSLRVLEQCKELRKLIVSKCCELEELPSMETLKSLEELRVEECVTLKSIRGLAQCTNLRHLNVSGCFQLQKLPSMETFESLEEFYASKCLNVKSIRGLAQCTKLRHLNVSGCSDLESLPSMETLVSLEELRVNECVKLKNIQGRLLQCTKLKHLDVSGCFELGVLPSMEALVSLEELWANRCVKLETISGLEHATNLRQLNVSKCYELEELPNMETLRSLEELWVDDCVKLKSITGLEQATKLRLLNVSGCSQLNELPIMETLVSLKMLRAIGCVKLKSIRGLEHCTELSILSVSRCCELEELPSMETLTSLKELWANKCVKLKNIKGLEHATKLQQLNISECSELEELPSMETLVSLEMIGITGCVKLKSIQGLAKCTKLRKLSFSGCCELKELPIIEPLIYLESLRVDGCVKLRSITGLRQCKMLRHIDVSGCSLESLRVDGCVKLRSITGLGQCKMLRHIDVSGCSELTELEGVENCTLLEKLDLSKCPKLLLGVEVLEQLRLRLKRGLQR